MPSLTEEQWIAVRAEWETGVGSERALAQKWGIDRKQVIRRRSREEWVRLDSQRDAIVSEANLRTATRAIEIQGVAEEVFDDADPVVREARVAARIAELLAARPPQRPGTSPPGANGRPTLPRPVLSAELRELAQRESREVAIETAVRTISDVSLVQMQEAQEQRAMLDAYRRLVMEVLTGDEATARAAAGRILVTRGDSLAAAVATCTRSAEGIQKMERLALGLDKAPAKGGQSEEGGTSLLSNENGAPVIDTTQLSTEDLAALSRVAAMLDGSDVDDLPLPPSGPIMISSEISA